MKTVKINSYAKVNIGLKLLQKRIDGYHDISTVFQEIDLHDEITISRSSNSVMEFYSNVDWLKNDQYNLCVIAYNRIKDLFDIGGVEINLVKNISKMLGLNEKKVSIKATTTDYLGYIGQSKGWSAISIATIFEINEDS